MSSLTCRPSRPPWAFTSLAHSWYPLSNAWPSARKGSLAPPLSDRDAPMTIGVMPLFVGVVPLELLALVQAASTPMPSSTVVLATNLVPVNRGRTGLTPIVIPAETVSCWVNGAKSVYRPPGTGLQITAAPSTTRPSSALARHRDAASRVRRAPGPARPGPARPGPARPRPVRPLDLTAPPLDLTALPPA